MENKDIKASSMDAVNTVLGNDTVAAEEKETAAEVKEEDKRTESEKILDELKTSGTEVTQEEIKSSEKKRSNKILLIICAIVAIFIIAANVNSDKSLGVATDFRWDKMGGLTFEEVLNKSEFCDDEWEKQGDNYTTLRFNNIHGDMFVIKFRLYNDGNSVNMESLRLNGEDCMSANNVYNACMEYFETGDYDEFETDLWACDVVNSFLGDWLSNL